ncbi:MAG: ribonuclease PH [Pseudomonadota bacterium]
MMRADRRAPDQLRAMACETGINVHAEGSCLFSMGNTRVYCTATVTNEIPRWRRDSGLGWVTAEYRMLPRATQIRGLREGRNDLKGRTAEIQRLIARALRSVVDLKALGQRQVMVDCDVLQADGGTRTASINGAFIALGLAMDSLVQAGQLPRSPVIDGVAAISVGLVDGQPMLDLAYDEDARADVDMNVIMTHAGGLVEVQGTAEGRPFARDQLDRLLDLATGGIQAIAREQRRIVGWA